MDGGGDGMVNGGGSGIVFGFSGVLNIGNVSAISINTISYGLDSAIGKGNVVASRGCVSITVLSLSKVDSRVIVGSGISEVVCGGDIRVDGCCRVVSGCRCRVVNWSGMVSTGWAISNDSGNNGSKSNDGLKMIEYFSI